MSIFHYSDLILSPKMRQNMRELESGTNLSPKSILTNRSELSRIYRLRVVALLTLAYFIFLVAAFVFASAHYLELQMYYVTRLMFATTFFTAIRYDFMTKTPVLIVLSLLSFGLNAFLVFFPRAEALLAIPPYFRFYSTIMPLTSLFTLYLLGRSWSLLFMVVSLAFSVAGFVASVGQQFSLVLTFADHSQFLVAHATCQILPLLIFQAFDFEADVYHSLLLRSLKNLEDKNEEKTLFISRMSHELRTPLQGLLSSASLLKETIMTEDQRTYTSIIDSCGVLLLNVVNRILDLTRIEIGKFEPEEVAFDILNLVPSLLESVSGLALSKGIELSFNFDPAAQTYAVLGDLTHLRSILVNVTISAYLRLVGNAVKFTKEGHVTISVWPTSAPCEPGSAVYRFEVTDTGFGIPEEMVPHLFLPFTKAHNYNQHEGSGLGLSVAKKFVEALHGSIGLSSKVGVGSTFWTEIPLVLNQADPSSLCSTLRASFAGIAPPTIGILINPIIQRGLVSTLTLCQLPFEIVGSRKQLQKFSFVVIDETSEVTADLAGFLKDYPPASKALVIVSLSTTSFKTEIARQGLSDRIFSTTKPVSPRTFGFALQALLGVTGAPIPGKGALSPSPPAVFAEETLPSALSLQVLVAEDNPVNQIVLKKQMQNIGVRFSVTSRAEDVVAAWEAQEQGVPLILMDVELDGEMTGLQATALIREKESKLSEEAHKKRQRSFIAIMTGRALEEDKREALECGGDVFLAKPVTLAQIRALVQEAVKT